MSEDFKIDRKQFPVCTKWTLIFDTKHK